jgi:hypothetical protein
VKMNDHNRQVYHRLQSYLGAFWQGAPLHTRLKTLVETIIKNLKHGDM